MNDKMKVCSQHAAGWGGGVGGWGVVIGKMCSAGAASI